MVSRLATATGIIKGEDNKRHGILSMIINDEPPKVRGCDGCIEFLPVCLRVFACVHCHLLAPSTLTFIGT